MRLTLCHLAHMLSPMVDVPNGPGGITGALAGEIRREMECQGLTGVALASRSRLDRASLSRWTRGLRAMSTETLSQIAAGLGLTASELLARAEAAMERGPTAPRRRVDDDAAA